MSLFLRVLFLLSLSCVFFVYINWTYSVITLPLDVGLISFDFSIILDKISIRGIIVVLLISTCVFLFRHKYILEDHNEKRFSLILAMFVLSILLLLVRNSIPFLLLGWDGLGVTSFLLIIYYDRKTNNRSGLITFTINRFGDAIIIGNIIFFIRYGHITIGTYLGVWLGVRYIVVAITKRAQYPFSIWLPLAIDAPTPVSALVHRRTLVTAGLFFLARLVPERVNVYLCFIGRVTLCVGGICAMYSCDLKKLIANSTLSNLGLIIIILSICNKNLMIFHLFTHALFKAGLFILAGRLLINRFGAQDGRRIYRSLNISPLLTTFIRAFFISSTGIFFLSTFFSKHHIIMICQARTMNSVRIVLVFLGVMLRTLYRLRFAYVIRGNKHTTVINSEVPWEVKIAIFILAFSSIFFGNNYNIGFLYSMFCYEVPILSVIIFRVVLFLYTRNRRNSTLFSSILYMDTMIDVFYQKNNFVKVLRVDYGFGRLEIGDYAKGLKINLRGLSRDRVNLLTVLVFTSLILLFI